MPKATTRNRAHVPCACTDAHRHQRESVLRAQVVDDTRPAIRAVHVGPAHSHALGLESILI
eukprot:3345564-Prymnesium_polylepis.1